MRILIGIDDTDNLESRGTGYCSRQLGFALADAGVEMRGISRHQLLVDPRIPYTSHNSSACLDMEFESARHDEIAALCRAFLLEHSASGSDVGLCIAPWGTVTDAVVAFGSRAKVDVLTMAEAEMLAAANGIFLQGLTGTHGGIIGSLAAVGLRVGGNDGRVLWMPHLRDTTGILTVALLRDELHLDRIETEAGRIATPYERVNVGEWFRPIVRNGGIALIVEEADHAEYDFITAPKERIKQLSN
jgi:hypothetical protein